MKCIWLIHADGSGNPTVGGPYGHFVVRSDAPMPADNQMHDGGTYPAYDCACGCVRSIVVSEGHPAPDAKWCESVAHTQPPDGTFWQGVEALLNALHIKWHFVNGDPPPGWIMNPFGGRVIPPSGFESYHAASQHQYLVIDEVPAPPPEAVTSEEDMRFLIIDTTDGNGSRLVDTPTGALLPIASVTNLANVPRVSATTNDFNSFVKTLQAAAASRASS